MKVNIIVERLACSNPAKVILIKIWVCPSKQLQINPSTFVEKRNIRLEHFTWKESKHEYNL